MVFDNVIRVYSVFTQGDSEAKANNLGGDSIGHCEKKVYLNT